ncbi:hypothetical protein G7Z92_07610 [Citrobacter werkmanii]|nr:hypothetical protein [Citrobacter werkmanii]
MSLTHQDGCLLSYDAYGVQQFYFPNILKYNPDQFSLRMENVADIHELMSESTGNHTLNVIGYVPGTNFGGGQFYWDASKPKSQHNGITIFSPTVPWVVRMLVCLLSSLVLERLTVVVLVAGFALIHHWMLSTLSGLDMM